MVNNGVGVSAHRLRLKSPYHQPRLPNPCTLNNTDPLRRPFSLIKVLTWSQMRRQSSSRGSVVEPKIFLPHLSHIPMN